jgi:hypothetical protein
VAISYVVICISLNDVNLRPIGRANTQEVLADLIGNGWFQRMLSGHLASQDTLSPHLFACGKK